MCLILISNLHLLLTSHLCLKSLCEHFFQLDHCRSDFFFLKGKIHNGSKHFSHFCYTPAFLLDHSLSVLPFPNTRLSLVARTSSGQIQVIKLSLLLSILLNSCLPCILISLFMYSGAIFSFFNGETHCSKHDIIPYCSLESLCCCLWLCFFLLLTHCLSVSLSFF